ncbi:MAG: DUF1343 domain-containing protein [Verrucomicrobiae bacterium]|nr:DUF1343 domain-containing protein [Verrucomicrobiae bacterium]MCP5538631.1 DUF1343 domain-containing protein [Akkermansiaceae bacterium]MCP5550906.1 DUF1343 domain-containing protein [Akkermansiaceae bacterium]
MPFSKILSRFATIALLAAAGPARPAANAALDPAKLDAISRAIRAAIGRGEIPGAVFRLEHRGEVFEKAHGLRARVPGEAPMTPDTLFDAASLTKVLATAPSVCLLADRGQLDLDARLVDLLPEFGPKPALRPLFRDKFDTSADTEANRAKVTVRQMLTHTSGLPPSISIKTDWWWGHEEGVRRCLTTPLINPPGAVFRYSDINYILLGEIVRRLSGERLDTFAAREIFGPLGMTDTGFLPAREDRGRVAPTVVFEGYGGLLGEVHDPVARRMEGAAGHAGAFTTAADVARYAASFLKGAAGPQILSPEMRAQMTAPQSPAGVAERRGLGWDIDSPFAYQRGEVFPVGGFGHTGWTGTSVWVDPGSETVVVLMTNRNHPSEAGSIKNLRVEVGTLAAEAVGLARKGRLGPEAQATNRVESSTQPCWVTAAGDPPPRVMNGIDTLAADGFTALKGRTIGLITNHTGIDREGRSTIDRLASAPGVTLKALFAPEHGIRGVLDTANIDDDRDAKTGLPIHSLYKSKERKPSASQLDGLDTLVFDIQDVGCRFYTYISTMGNAMEAAAARDLKFVVLDRVNPIGGEIVDGPVRMGESKFTAWHPIPVRHGMTAGELARLFKAERGWESLDLVVVPVRGWSRGRFFDETGLPWVNPSPNMRSQTEAILYPGVGLLEFCKLSVGRGTATPFEVVGAPYIDENRLAAALAAAASPGVRFEAARYTPDASVFANEECGGVRLHITDREKCVPLDVGLTLAVTLHRLYPEKLGLREHFDTLLRHPPTLEAVARGDSIAAIRKLWEPALAGFRARRGAFLLYD